MGVWRVKNNLKVRPEQIPGNDELETRTGRAFLNDPYIERFDLDINAYNGTVYLSGTVNTSWEKQRAEVIAEGVKGAIYVINNIEYEHEWAWKPDWEIKEDVNDEFFWSPFVDGDDVNVAVDDGIVTLTGEVDTYSERQDAEENAFEGGAKDVLNNLTVAYKYYGPENYDPYWPYF
jgi:osmotically-inducible protein OsmY